MRTFRIRIGNLAVAAAVIPAMALLTLSAAHGQASTPESTSLEKCQKVVQKEASKYAAKLQKGLGTCLQKAARAVVQVNLPSVSVIDATNTCISQFYKIGRIDGKALEDKTRAKITKFCDPGPGSKAVHSEDDVTGIGAPSVQHPLGSIEISGYCGGFGGGAGSFADWLDCLAAAARCQARQQIAVQFPRALSWLDALDTQMSLSSKSKAPVARAALQATIAAIDPDADGDADLSCGPALVAGIDAIVLATGQQTLFGTGSDGDVQAGVQRFYNDNGDGTITDNRTGLMWEKKDDSGGIHDKDAGYTWCEDADVNFVCDNGANEMDGTIVTGFLDTLNDVGGGGANCFAGYCDWRIPNLTELASLVHYGTFQPAVDPAFHQSGTCTGCTDVTLPACSCISTTSDSYWSSTTFGPGTLADFAAFSVSFVDGFSEGIEKVASRHVRAVRGGI